MLGTYIDIILYPVQKYLDMLLDVTIKNHLGVSVLGIAVTCAITMIVVTALVYRINAGAALSSGLLRRDHYNSQKSNRSDRTGPQYKQSNSRQAIEARRHAMNRNK